MSHNWKPTGLYANQKACTKCKAIRNTICYQGHYEWLVLVPVKGGLNDWGKTTSMTHRPPPCGAQKPGKPLTIKAIAERRVREHIRDLEKDLARIKGNRAEQIRRQIASIERDRAMR